jgi:hypothetical protein
MKRKVRSTLLLLAVSLLVLWGCKKEDRTTDTTFTLVSTESPAPDTQAGYFTASGDPTTSGTFVMTIQLVGTDSLHCSQVLTVKSVGSITIISDCSLTTNTGTWFITTGNGAYANLHGNGSLIMSFPENGSTVEALQGKTWRH